ncbi:MDR family MFS transporter [Bacillus glycinifermentans]|uniref:MDR family MFS transporter n=1 Tax=Bacillus glycinifermentans TaxID=1664069 RepID=A0A0T6BW00_9BACI|nr:MDR family MFS transporter [Bacillus glycinifermentans]ATH94372.1 MFS transporter [Bacillus glycinifermentans]KRT95797.1 multidrug MFS transporter [Bacillus glycinifermentans]MEC0484297.1 MDR family MFS transporter [Bacillus glycinifermentans]MEC3607361.1 MDR family MFS transporter [Bacillus glycinifermentans]
MSTETEHQTYNRKIIVGLLIAGAFIAILNQTLLVTALPHIMADLNIDATQGQWLTTAFMLTNGILIPITAFLIEKFSSRALVITAMAIFTAGTVVGAFAPNFPVLLAARIIQAAGAGIMMPLMQTIFLTIFPVDKRGAAMGMVGLVIAFAPAIGPTLSGWIVDSFTWRYLFYIILPIAVIDLILVIMLMKNVTKLRETSLDILSIILSTLGFGGLLYGFSSAGSDGWGDQTVLISLAVGAVSLIFFIMRQMKIKRPILEFRVFQSWTFSLTTLLGMIVFALMIGTETILPLYTQNVRSISAFDSGLMLLPGAIAMGIMSPIIGKIFDKIGGKGLAIIGFAILLLTSIPFADLKDDTSITFIVILYTIRMAGTSMIMMPLTTAGINALPPHLIAHGTAMNNTMRQIGGSIGTAVLISVMSNSTKNASTTNPINAVIHGMNSAFIVAAVLALAGFILSFTLKRKVQKEGQPAR